MSLSTTSQQIIVEQAAAHLTPQASYIFVGVFAVLCFASIIGQWLKRKNGADNATIANLNARIYAWWLMTLVLLGAFWFGKIGTVVLFFLISFAALREFMTLVYRRRSDYYSMVVCFYLLLPVQYYFVYDWLVRHVQHFYSGLRLFDTADYCQPQRPNGTLFGTRRQNTMDGDDLHLLSVSCSGADVSGLGWLR